MRTAKMPAPPNPYPAPPVVDSTDGNLFSKFAAFLNDLFRADTVSAAPLAVDAPVGEVYFLLSDHLGSTTMTLNVNGNVVSETRYGAWGNTRYTSGVIPTDRKYTGQIEEASGLYFYNARWYDSSLGRFIQADYIVQDLYNPLDWDHYSYVSNNPVNFIDPNGHVVDDPGDECSWWDLYTPIYILEHVQNDLDQRKMLVAYMYEHPDYIPETDQQIIEAGYDPSPPYAYLSIEKFKAEAIRAEYNQISLSELWNTYVAPAIAASIILGGGDLDGDGSSDTPLRGHLAFDAAKELGYIRRIPPQKTPFNSHGQPVFYNPNTTTYISPDIDAHNGGVWKMFDSKGNRIGAYDGGLNLIGK